MPSRKTRIHLMVPAALRPRPLQARIGARLTASPRRCGRGQESGGRPRDMALAATVRAAAPHQRARGREGSGLVVRPTDLRENVREGREGNLILFLVDASGSMAARKRMSAVK